MSTRIKREARVWAIVALMTASYLAGSANSDCWGWLDRFTIERGAQ
jgi:hypothetical protein